MKTRLVVISLLAVFLCVAAPLTAFSQTINSICENASGACSNPAGNPNAFHSSMFVNTWVSLYGSGFPNTITNGQIQVDYPLQASGTGTEFLTPTFTSTSLGQMNFCLAANQGTELDNANDSHVTVGLPNMNGVLVFNGAGSAPFTLTNNPPNHGTNQFIPSGLQSCP